MHRLQSYPRHILLLQPYRRFGRFAFDHQQLAELLAREGGAQLEGRNEPFEATRDIVKRRLVAIGKALNQASVTQESFPTAVVASLELSCIMPRRSPPLKRRFP